MVEIWNFADDRPGTVSVVSVKGFCSLERPCSRRERSPRISQPRDTHPTTKITQCILLYTSFFSNWKGFISLLLQSDVDLHSLSLRDCFPLPFASFPSNPISLFAIQFFSLSILFLFFKKYKFKESFEESSPTEYIVIVSRKHSWRKNLDFLPECNEKKRKSEFSFPINK